MTRDTEPDRGRRSSAPSRELPLLAEAKLAAPRRRAGIVERPRLVHLLDSGASAELTLVTAPLGYGKTTAVQAWCASRPMPLAWVTLDAGDNEPTRLWRYVATAVDRVRAGLGRPALQRLSLPGEPIKGCVDELMNGVKAFGEELVIVLDDLNAVTDSEAIASIGHAIEHLPHRARLVAITRFDPILTLGAMRARGGLAEVRAVDLAFTSTEAQAVLLEHGEVDLAEEELELLIERTEGWPAALFLAALWLRSVDDPGRAVREFGGDHRFVAEYLSTEVLGALDEDVRSFLLRASVLRRFTSELADDVLGLSDSASKIADLERSNLFVFPVGHAGWVRVHSLFAEFAALRLGSEEPGAAELIHRSAAEWFSARGLPEEAVEHAAAAGDHELVAGVLSDSHLTLIRNGESDFLLRWVQTLPDQVLEAHPELTASAATAAAMLGNRSIEKRRLLGLADLSEKRNASRESTYARAVVNMVRAGSIDGDVGAAVEYGRSAVEIAMRGADDVLLASLASYAHALYLAGDMDGAWAAALRAIERPDAERQVPGHMFARSTLALVAVERGDLALGRRHARTARSLASKLGPNARWLAANALVAHAVVLFGEGDVSAAERALGRAERFLRDEIPTLDHAFVLVLLARLHCRRGRLDRAEQTLRSALGEIRSLADSGRVASLADEVRRDLDEANVRAGNGDLLERPSEAELAVLRLLPTDLSTREIAGQLFLSPNTVRSHTRSIYRKLGVNARVDAVARATSLGLLTQTESPI